MKPEQKIIALYNSYRKEFIENIKKKYPYIETEVIENICQDSFINLHKKLLAGQVVEHNTNSLKNYLFITGKNMVKKYLEKQKKIPTSPFEKDNMPELEDTSWRNEDELEWMAKQEVVRQVVEEMGDPCKTVLQLYYWLKKSMQEISGIMEYQNEQVAKNRKSLCMRKLKELLKERFKKEDLI